MTTQVTVVDSHTAGEPTRVVLSGVPELDGTTLQKQADCFNTTHAWLRHGIVNEPRGSDILVGALLLPPRQASSAASVIFFNNVGLLGMCGHGMIGVIRTLQHLKQLTTGIHTIDTVVGPVQCELHANGDVSLQNVPSFRHAAKVPVNVPGYGVVHGDVAWGGNWFFLVSDHGQQLLKTNTDHLVHYTWLIRQSLEANNIRGREDLSQGIIDHIELFGPPINPHHHSQNFVLCPGKAYDRSPCGTGTSAKLACLAADYTLQPGEHWRQESILGTVFEGSYVRATEAMIIPTIRGRASIIAEATLYFPDDDILSEQK